MKIIRSLLSLFLLCTTMAAWAGDSISVLQWNVWQEGTVVSGGYEAIVNEIVRLKPDFVTLSEVRNYNQSNFNERILRSLRERGETYYGFYSYDTGLLSRHPISDSLTVFPCQNDHGSIYRLLCEAKGRKFAVYTAHLDYQNDTYYEVRGYDGNTWKEMPPLTDVAEILRRNDLSLRDEATRMFLRQADLDAAQGYAVIIGGDFNEPSPLDWTSRTAHLYDHHGTVVPWTVCRLMLEAGFTDAYRAVWPDELTHPGFTYPADNKDVPAEKLTWAPKGDERDRIDYVLFRGSGLRATSASVFGPEGCIVRGQRAQSPGQDPFILPLGTWPTDHKGVLVTLQWE